MDADATTAQPAKFSRYRAVRKATGCEEAAPSVPKLAHVQDQDQEGQRQVNRAPSRYRRPTAPPPPSQDVLLPQNDNVRLPGRSNAQQNGPRPRQPPEAAVTNSAVPPTSPAQQEQLSFEPTEQRPEQRAEQPAALAPRTTRYRSRTTSAPRQNIPSHRRSYDAAREEARMILEGEYDRLKRLKQQQEQAAYERKQTAEAKLAAQRHAQAEQERAKAKARAERDAQAEQDRANTKAKAQRDAQVEQDPANSKAKAQRDAQAEQDRASTKAKAQRQAQMNQQEEQKPQRARKWTIGDASTSKSHPASVPQSPPSQGAQPLHGQSSRKVSTDERRRKADNDHSVPVDPSDPLSDAERPTLRQRLRRPTLSRQKEIPAPRPFEPKAGDGPPKTAVNGPMAAIDAPVSAVNAGERRVEVRFDKSKITLPVTPTTTVKDLLNSASIILSQPIDPRNAVLVETYYPLGLERPLRRYEHIRDIMNSWDSDTQNYLMILPRSECEAVGLDQTDAPTEQPSSKTVVHLHHSQRPGRWDKHWIVLRTDGQVTASSKENDLFPTNVFHLSDFDVYMPTKKQSKKLRPPKKICFAIKSQQRSIMFESTENFVHFFSTNDKAVADQWYNAAQAWRSWYLINVLGEGTVAKPAPALNTALPILGNGPLAFGRPSTSYSRDSIPYQLGTFQPLLDFSVTAFKYGEDLDPLKSSESKPPGSPPASKTLVGHARNASTTGTKATGLERHMTTKRQAPPAAQTHHREVSTARVPPNSTDAAFTGKGLLARAFSVKKAAAEQHASLFENTDNAFTGTGLLSRRLSTRKHGGTENLNPGVVENTNDAFTGAGLLSIHHSVTKKSGTSGRAGQPLVDLSANSNFQDGSLLRQVEGVEIATGQNLPAIDRSRGLEVTAKTGEE